MMAAVHAACEPGGRGFLEASKEWDRWRHYWIGCRGARLGIDINNLGRHVPGLADVPDQDVFELGLRELERCIAADPTADRYRDLPEWLRELWLDLVCWGTGTARDAGEFAAHPNHRPMLGLLVRLRAARAQVAECAPELDLSATRPAGAAGPGGAGGRPGRGKKGKDIDAKMLKLVWDDLERLDWSSPRWAAELDCSEGTVRDSHTWKVRIPQLREMERAARGRAEGARH